MITTAEQYHRKIKSFDRDRTQAEIDRIPYNVNRAGKHYKKLLKIIRQKHDKSYKQSPSK